VADTALNEEEIIEYNDTEEELDAKIKILGDFVQQSTYMLVYTGAGISTAAGISDFRGPEGVWTRKAQGLDPVPSTPRSKVKPTLTHMALVQLQQLGYLKCLVSQNCDGLHLKSGIPPDRICELHGNTNVEACSLCGKLYYRSFGVRTNRNKAKITERFCDDCKIPLRYTTVAFSQSMPDMCLNKALVQSKKSDLSICLGTSMRVSPACELPLKGKKTHANHKLVIVNLQKTPYDDHCALRIYARVDIVMTKLFEYLKQDIPEYVDLNLTSNQQFKDNFHLNYPFRTAGSTDWFTGNHLPQSKEEIGEE